MPAWNLLRGFRVSDSHLGFLRCTVVLGRASRVGSGEFPADVKVFHYRTGKNVQKQARERERGKREKEREKQ